ncbi:MAG: RNA methyltransferase [Phycisphaerae bacterium]
MLDRIRFVLVRSQVPGNVGAICRAMMNMGLSDLFIVSPECDPLADEARWRAMRALPILEAARVVPTVAEALDGCVLSFATSAKGGFYRRQIAAPPCESARVALEATAGGQVAFVFGPEDHGLTQGELLDFDRLVEIPANPQYGALNIAAAAMVIAYELYTTSLEMAGSPLLPPQDPPADDQRKRVMFEKLFAALDRIGFFDYQQTPEHLQFAIRRVLGRAAMSVNEVDIFIGIAQQIQSFARRHDGKANAE